MRYTWSNLASTTNTKHNSNTDILVIDVVLDEIVSVIELFLFVVDDGGDDVNERWEGMEWLVFLCVRRGNV